MHTLKVRATTVAVTAGTVSLVLAAAAFGGPPVLGASNAAQEAIRMSMLTRAMVAQKTAATSQKATTATTVATGQKAPTATTVATGQKAPTATTAATNQKATTATHTTGQPGQMCGSATAPNTPGNAASAPGSAFNPNGKAGTVYAGTQPQNSKNPTSVSQYDVACSHQPK
jgi:hypothetical protein